MERKLNNQAKLKVRKGDMVRIIAGDDKGKEGKVLEVILETRRVVVEGHNIVKKHQKPTAGKPEGEIKKTEAAMHISNVMVIDPASGKATRIGRKTNAKGKLQRYAKKTGELIK
jgi:large subunit ribosomal protein L24